MSAVELTRPARSTDRAELGHFLRCRREALRPADVGLSDGPRRRTPGLRRSEVAALANMSVDYYERLEQARAPQPSASLLSSIARALRLTAEERAHLYRLAGQAPPASVEPVVEVDPGLSYVLAAVAATTPAAVTDDLSTVLAQNELNVALFGDFAGRPGREANLVWLWFTSPAWRALLRSQSPADEEATGLAYVGDLRATVALRGHDPVATAFVADLREASAEFATLWDEHRVTNLRCSVKTVVHDRVGPLELDCVIVLGPPSMQRLLMMQPVPETGTAARLADLFRLITSADPPTGS